MRKLVFFMLAFCLLAGCRTQYVPVETVRTERVEIHDTVTIGDSIVKNDSTDTKTKVLLQKVDSAYLALLGIINAPKEAWLLQMETTTTHNSSVTSSHKESEKSSSDSIRTEYKDRPYPVEKQLSRSQQFFIDYGKIMLGVSGGLLATTIIFFIMWLRKKRGLL